MAKAVAQQLALFAGLSIAGDTRGVFAKEVKNKAGIKKADVITFLPIKSKEKDDMADATGLKGQQLKFHNSAVRQAALATAFGLVSGEVAKGGYELANNGLRRGVDGTITLKMRPSSIRVVQKEMTDEELIAEIQKRKLALPE